MRGAQKQAHKLTAWEQAGCLPLALEHAKGWPLTVEYSAFFDLKTSSGSCHPLRRPASLTVLDPPRRWLISDDSDDTSSGFAAISLALLLCCWLRYTLVVAHPPLVTSTLAIDDVGWKEKGKRERTASCAPKVAAGYSDYYLFCFCRGWFQLRRLTLWLVNKSRPWSQLLLLRAV